nr:hypothetical protein [Bacteroidota bacterium]
MKTTAKYLLIFLLTFSINFANPSTGKSQMDCANSKPSVETTLIKLTHPIDTLKCEDDNTREFLIKSHSTSWFKDHHYYSFEDEGDVDDIPFNTKEIVDNLVCKGHLAQAYAMLDIYYFDFEDEKDVDDIPFDTKEIYDNIIDIFHFDFEDEEDVDDLPFNTQEVVNNYLVKNNK